MSTKEKLPFSFDTTPLLLAGEVPTTPVVYVTQNDTGASVPGAISGAATISGNLVQQTLLGSALTPGKSYRVEITFQVSSTKIWDMELVLICPY
jgi:hypothetical protein